MTASLEEGLAMALLQYLIPAATSRLYLRSRGKSAGRYTNSTLRVAHGQTDNVSEVVAAGHLASLVWPVIAISTFVLGLICIFLLTHALGAESVFTTAAVPIFATPPIAALAVVVAVHARLRPAVRSLAQKESVVSGIGKPKPRDFWIAVGLSLVVSLLIWYATAH
jgi:hypothetical protein